MIEDSNTYIEGMTMQEIKEASQRLFRSVMGARGILNGKSGR